MSPWKVELADTAKKQLAKLDRGAQERIVRYLFTRIQPASDPAVFGKPLRGDAHGLWRYRVDDYRVICRIDAGKLIVLVVKVGHRADVYE
ncbi:MAG: type II toxin-antitoxin system RelE/ParE family toxin [Opitutus sp.]|jgi:mRNA interferase RelE/StbE|nr:type II toxin-antitoxin system RelE/ParE family toxin [Opitutus sp.]MCS6246741.1 type II toxin-antitoxin system RelE/ParE family toxin [Opitutus sp.]MCS6273297.1 type II toxin-antitoxin system RelE/ParE family toxin [Opitutus sp.]MCS6276165.1 type II toxin-antitoxin system RelE/ParE family toxin [Opitutus sp.]MCS6301259.1 type II toxin-antitoxin system RelE/ParE family toxin [Opitutus sp.]